MKVQVLQEKQSLLNEALMQVEHENTTNNLHAGEKKALQIQYALVNLEKQIETKAAIRYSLIYDAYTQAWFNELGIQSLEEWMDAFGMNPREDGNLGQVYRIATILTTFCEEQYIKVNGNFVDHDWFIDQVGGKCRVNRARNIISKAQGIIEMTSKTADQRADEVTQLLRWVDDPKITNAELLKQVNGDEGEGGEGGEGFRIAMSASYNGDGSFNLSADLDEDEYNFFKRKAGYFVEINEVD